MPTKVRPELYKVVIIWCITVGVVNNFVVIIADEDDFSHEAVIKRTLTEIGAERRRSVFNLRLLVGVVGTSITATQPHECEALVAVAEKICARNVRF